MGVKAYYNEIDPYAADWLENLIAAGHIADGVVDRRSIEDVTPDDLGGFRQCHFFAGIGIWSYALRRAGVPDDAQVWTGSCPCQPFSAAGKGGGVADERHLWPHFHWLISQCRPADVLGEQVASKDGLGWLDLVQADLEGTGYASGALDTCAAGFGAPHIRQRLWWGAKRLADDQSVERQQLGSGRQAGVRRQGPLGERGTPDRLGHPDSPRAEVGLSEQAEWKKGLAEVDDNRGDRLLRPGEGRSVSGGVADSDGRDTRAEREQRSGQQRQQPEDGGAVGLDHSASAQHTRSVGNTEINPRNEARVRVSGAGREEDIARRPGPTDGFWRDADWLFCRDGKWRPVEPGTFPLAHGAASRVGRLRAYGNAIVAEAAQAFVEAYFEL